MKVYVVLRFCYGECQGVDSVWTNKKAAQQKAASSWVEAGDYIDVEEYKVEDHKLRSEFKSGEEKLQ